MAHLKYSSLTLAAGVLTLAGSMAQADIVQNDDVIITFSLCVGNDCSNGESFGFDTIRLKENNLRIHFNDTSSTASFPSNDWRITVNDSSNGGANYFAIEDATASRIPFRVEAGARANALYVEADSDVGIGTANPVVNLHITEGNTPTLRLEQDGSSGFTPQTYDLAANEANFFIRDVTNSSRLFFRAKPGAPEDSIFIANDGDIGLGTDAPGSDLHVLRSGSAFTANSNTLALFQNNSSTDDTTRISLLSGNAGVGQFAFGDAENEFAGRIRYFHTNNEMDFILDGSVEVLSMFSSGANALETATSAAVLTSAGVWQDASSRALKQDIETLSLDAAKEALEGLKPVTFSYIKEPDETTVGFIAEDVPDLVATSSRETLSSLDIVAVLTRVVQEQQDVIASLEQRLEQIEAAD